MKHTRGFTLVELAIVITIIGLLIGGVLKGQELLENSRMTASAAQVKSYAAASMTFKDIYKAYPGDLRNPADFIQNCTASPCNISGDGNGMVGPSTWHWYWDENNNYWLHMSKAGLIPGIDPNSNWSTSDYFRASLPDFKMGGKMTIADYIVTAAESGGTYPNGLTGQYYMIVLPIAAGTTTSTPPITVSAFGKFDLKVDDGRPWSGSVIADGMSCSVPVGAQNYDPNNKNACYYNVKTDL